MNNSIDDTVGTEQDEATDPHRHERGYVSVFLVCMVGALVLVAALVYDGGAKLRAIDHAQSAAEQAVRVTAQAITGSVMEGQRPVVATSAAVELGQQALAMQDVVGTVQVSGDTVTVTAQSQVRTVFFGGTVTGTGSATARVAVGMEQEVP